MPAIKVGDKLPEFTFFSLVDGAPKPVPTSSFVPGKKIVIFGLPGAFTPTCSKDHCPSYVLAAAQLKAKGIAAVYCTATNDAFVLDAWADSLNAKGKLQMLADGNAEFAKKVGLDLDLTAHGMGIRSQRYAIVAEDGVVKYVGVDGPGQGVTNSGASAILAHL